MTYSPTFRKGAESRQHRVLRAFGHDQSMSKEYRFNSIGFRGEDRNRDAAKLVYVFGCSNTFGVGLNEDELWHHHFRNEYARSLGLTSTQVNLMNFGLDAGSCPEIARNVVLQCSVEAPDLAVVQFTYPDRDELILDDLVVPMGPWLCNKEVPETLQTLAVGYYEQYREEQAAMTVVRSMLLAQFFFEARGIDYAMQGWKPNKVTRPVNAMFELLNHDRIWWANECLQHRWTDPVLKADVAADGLHFGPNINRTIAESLWLQYLQVTNRGQASR